MLTLRTTKIVIRAKSQRKHADPVRQNVTRATFSNGRPALAVLPHSLFIQGDAMRIAILLFTLLLALPAQAGESAAENHAKAIAPYVDEQTFVVGHIDVS